MTELVHTVSDPRAVQALAQPIRVRLLEALREPQSAAGVARQLGLPRQKVNYHLKELARVGLARHAGERRKGNFIEQLYQAVARRFVISGAVTRDTEKLESALRDQVSLARLAEVGERIGRDAAGLLDRAAYEGAQVPSATVEAEIRFAGARERSAFMEEYLAAIGPLLKKYGAGEAPRGGDPRGDGARRDGYRIAVAIYPDPAPDDPPPETRT